MEFCDGAVHGADNRLTAGSNIEWGEHPMAEGRIRRVEKRPQHSMNRQTSPELPTMAAPLTPAAIHASDPIPWIGLCRDGVSAPPEPHAWLHRGVRVGFRGGRDSDTGRDADADGQGTRSARDAEPPAALRSQENRFSRITRVHSPESTGGGRLRLDGIPIARIGAIGGFNPKQTHTGRYL